MSSNEQLFKCLSKNAVPVSPLVVLMESAGISASSVTPTAKAVFEFLAREKHDEKDLV